MSNSNALIDKCLDRYVHIRKVVLVLTRLHVLEQHVLFANDSFIARLLFAISNKSISKCIQP